MRRACACFALRRAARAVTRHFNATLAPGGLTATQFMVLAALRVKTTTIVELAESLAMDPSTLSRNLGPLVRRALVERRPGEDRRERAVALTALGRSTLGRSYPLWIAAQSAIEAPLGPAPFSATLSGLRALTRQAQALASSDDHAPTTTRARSARRRAATARRRR